VHINAILQCLIESLSLCIDRAGEAVLVKGARGSAPPDQYKISATYSSGYRLNAVCVVMGTKAAAKGRKTAEAILKRYASVKVVAVLIFVDSKKCERHMLKCPVF
jgi:Acyclic terpene utilisation family protein AtuA